jgi:anti-anti-sigma factor
VSLPSVTLIGGVPVARLPSDVDSANGERIGLALAESTPRDATCLILDLEETRYLDSVGIDMLFKLSEQLRRCRQTLRLAVPEQAPIRRILEIAAVERSMPVHPHVADALAAGSEPPASLT